MAMGKRRKQSQGQLWVETVALAKAPGHPFYDRLSKILDQNGFDAFVEKCCAKFYSTNRGRPSLPPAVYFRLLLVGYFEGIDAERAIAWRLADSMTPFRRHSSRVAILRATLREEELNSDPGSLGSLREFRSQPGKAVPRLMRLRSFSSRTTCLAPFQDEIRPRQATLRERHRPPPAIRQHPAASSTPPNRCDMA